MRRCGDRHRAGTPNTHTHTHTQIITVVLHVCALLHPALDDHAQQLPLLPRPTRPAPAAAAPAATAPQDHSLADGSSRCGLVVVVGGGGASRAPCPLLARLLRASDAERRARRGGDGEAEYGDCTDRGGGDQTEGAGITTRGQKTRIDIRIDIKACPCHSPVHAIRLSMSFACPCHSVADQRQT